MSELHVTNLPVCAAVAKVLEYRNKRVPLRCFKLEIALNFEGTAMCVVCHPHRIQSVKKMSRPQMIHL